MGYLSLGDFRLPFKLVFFLFIIVCFTGCELDESVSVQSRPARSAAIVQSRVNELGRSEVAIAISPTGPGVPPVSLQHLEGLNLFSPSLEGVRAANYNGDAILTEAPFYKAFFGERIRTLNPFPGQIFTQISRNDFEPGVDSGTPTYYGTDPYMAFHANFSDELSRVFTVGNGNVSSTIELVNGEGSTQIIVDGITRQTLQGPPTRVVFLLPLECGVMRRLDSDTIRRYIGTWTFDSSPPMLTATRDADATPFSFNIKSLVLEEFATATNPVTPPVGDNEPPLSLSLIHI